MGFVRRTILTALYLALAAAGSEGQSPQGWRVERDPDEVILHGFQIYDTQAAKSLAASAEEHIAAGRWSEALVQLQQLIEEHRDELLGPTRPVVKARGLRSEQDVYYGAADHATRRLFELTEEARTLYRKRFSERAATALRAAIADGDRAAITNVARRWPLTAEAERAWWALGDLELEFGNVAIGERAWNRALARALTEYSLDLEAPGAWMAALERLEREGGRSTADLAGIRARVELVLEQIDVDPNAEGTAGSALAPRLGFDALPGALSDTWLQPFELPGGHPFWSRDGRFSLFPASWDEIVFVSTTLELIAIGAYTGELLWQSDQAPGWSEVTGRIRASYFEAVDLMDSLIVPAAAHGVVVGALQVFVPENKIDYGEMEIIKIIPQRRLFAFEAATGRPLWNAAPAAGWDGESGSFAQRMRVVGSPTIVGSRVLVPSASLRGRIEYHVGCFDLYTGDLLWSTALITGQRELNMFGRKMEEFSAPPVRVVGDKVIALTQLGTVAALDLFTGDTLWEVLYEQIAIAPNRNYQRVQRIRKWRNAAPVVAGNTVIATPNDSEFLIAINLGSGALVWSMRHAQVNRIGDPSGQTGIDLLIGADDRHVYVGGRKIVALRSNRTVAKEAPTRRDWVFPAGDELIGMGTARPVLTRDRVYVPDQGELSILDVKTGKLVAGPTSWGRAQPGNLLIGDGMMFTLNSQRLGGYFDWDKLVERARAQNRADPEDLERALSLALLLASRGVAEWAQEGRVSSNKTAVRNLAEAREVLRSVMGEETHPRVLAELHSVLRAEARVLMNLADSQQAMRLLEEAQRYAPSREDLRDTLLERQAILYGRDQEAWQAVIGTLIEECADLHLLCEAVLTGEAGRRWSGRLIPLVGTREVADATTLRLPVGLWALISRAENLGSLGLSPAEFRDLHAILEHYGNYPMADFHARDWAAERIDAKLRAGDVEGYQVYEARALDLYDHAIGRQDVGLLERIPLWFPHSKAAMDANDSRLRLALERGDVATATSIVLGELRRDWHPESATDREIQHLIRLAHALGEAGNRALRAGFAQSLATYRPDTVVDLPGEERARLGDLAARWRLPEPPAPAASTATFDHAVHSVPDAPAGRFERLGELPPAAGGSGQIVLFAREHHIRAFTDEDGGNYWWTTVGLQESPDDWSGRFVATPGLAHLATQSRVVTLDRETGDVVWTWDRDSEEVLLLAESDGVVVVVELLHPDQRDHLAVGLDAVTGIELWRLVIDARTFHVKPVCGDRKVAFIPQGGSTRGEIHDIFTGRLVTTFEAEALSDKDAAAAWIAEERLVLPRFARTGERNHVFAIDLESGLEAWKVDLRRVGGERELTNIVNQDRRTYLVLRPKSGQAERRGAIYTLDPRIGSIGSGPLVELRSTDILMGVARLARTDLEAPFLFIWSWGREGESAVLRARRLPYGRGWDARLPVAGGGRYNRTMSLPALSDSTVAIVHNEPRPGIRGSSRTQLVFLDRSTGADRGSRLLPPDVGGARGVQLSALGDSLIICGSEKMEILK